MSSLSLTGIYRLHVSLDGVQPQIWRRVRVRSDESLAGLHEILQLAMGWSNSHVHLFQAGGREYGEPDPEWDVEDETGVAVHAVLRRVGDTITYVYDLGDEWRHTVRLESVSRDADPDLPVPFCEAGERACPPEDTGGAWRFMNLLEALPDPSHPDHRAWADWIGEFDADAFPIDLVNRLLHHFARRSRGRGRRGESRAVAPSRRRASGTGREGRARAAGGSGTAASRKRDAGYRPGAAVDAIVDAACAFMSRDPFFEQSVFELVIQMLILYDAANPGTFERATKPLGWAAGAIHGAIMTLPGYEEWTMDLPSLARAFGVTASTVQQKSLALRKHLERIVTRYDTGLRWR